MRRLVVPLLLVLVAGCGGGEDVAQPSPSPVASSPASTAGCPEAYDTSVPLWVPSPPTTETPGRLVPDADPVEALVCRYEPEGALIGEVLLEDGRNAIRHDLLLPEKLDGQQRPCTLIGGVSVPHLMRLAYADGDLWVSAVQEPNSCTDTGNGTFVSHVYTGDLLAQAYEQRRWTSPPPPERCWPTSGGRAGQEATLVPEGWTSLAVCRPGGPDPERREVDRATAERVADLLAQVRTTPGTSTCQGEPRTTYQLLFSWEQGPPVLVMHTPGCDPSMRNVSLDGTPTEQQGADLEDLLRSP